MTLLTADLVLSQLDTLPYSAKTPSIRKLINLGHLAPDWFKVNGASDDTASMQEAWQEGMDEKKKIFLPSARYYASAPMPTLIDNTPVEGRAEFGTKIVMDPAMTGRLITVRNAWQAAVTNWPVNGDKADLDSTRTGSSLRNFSVWGDRSTANSQDGIIYLDCNDNVDIDKVSAHYVKGVGIGTADSGLGNGNVSMRETNIGKIMARRCGTQTAETNYPFGKPGIHFFTKGSGSQDASNAVTFTDLTGIWSEGIDVLIENRHATLDMRFITINKAMIHGRDASGGTAQSTPRLMVIGRTYELNMLNVEIDGIRDNQWGVHLKQDEVTGGVPSLRFAGSIGSGSAPGNGILIDNAGHIWLDPLSIRVQGTELQASDNFTRMLVRNRDEGVITWDVTASTAAKAKMFKPTLQAAF